MHLSEKINQQASFFKKVFECLANKGAEIIEIDARARVETSKHGRKEEGAEIVLSAKASNKKYDAVIEEAKNIRYNERAPRRMECDLRETAEDDHWRYFALKLILGSRYNKNSFHDDFPTRLNSYKPISAHAQEMVMNHPSKEIGKQFAFYSKVIERLVAKGADIKSTSMATGISKRSWSGSVCEFSGFTIDTTVVNAKYDDFRQELQSIGQEYGCEASGRRFNKSRVAADSKSRTDSMSLWYSASL